MCALCLLGVTLLPLVGSGTSKLAGLGLETECLEAWAWPWA